MEIEALLEQYGPLLSLPLGGFLLLFGLVMTALERRLIVTRKVPAGWNGFTGTACGGIILALGLYQCTGSPLSPLLALAGALGAYLLLCRLVERKEYSEKDWYTKE